MMTPHGNASGKKQASSALGSGAKVQPECSADNGGEGTMPSIFSTIFTLSPCIDFVIVSHPIYEVHHVSGDTVSSCFADNYYGVDHSFQLQRPHRRQSCH